ncbi:Outer membrane receptor proteins, mostly Fe transport [Sphingomonas gellani]|uniref:Outer membrane receptor proteins, mostly Fe transport n=1 Tax=Sphingomonas gellani TaxID=1166340 RepID=A0A1H8DV59_9SPHN|nr:TonB-dependent receptor [Sphingomonas gellani]SEN11162.1 Outer membrane receptor proteins, mostly Fe transport [Sphingomonas gellani]
MVGGAVAALLMAAPAAAETLSVDLPAGSVGQQVMALGRVARISIVVPDPRLWSRRVPALRGRMRAAAAIALIARHADARVEDLGPGSWRLVPRPKRRDVQRPIRTEQAPQPQTGPDVVVTASKRDTTRGHFAGQFARVAGADLTFGGAGGTERLADRLTSVASTYLGAGRNKLFIRGIADSSFTGPTQATVGQYFGDLRLSYNAPDPDLRLSDLAAVEVLEGPQGTLYGAGSLGGLIRLVPNAPDPSRFSGSAMLGGSATQHGAPGADTQLVANMPVIRDRLAIRIVANAASEGGYIDKPLLDRTDVNRTRIEGGRVAAHLDLASGWSAELIGIGQRIRGADSQYADRDGRPLTRSAPVTEGFSADFGQAQLVLAGAFGDVRFRSTSGVTAHDLMERYDATAPDQPIRVFAQGNRTRMQANETRLWSSRADGSGWLAGFSYIQSRTRLTRLYGAPGALQPTTGVTNGIAETTLYGEGSVRLLPGLLTTAGLRVTRSVLDGEGADIVQRITAVQAAMTAQRAQTIVLPSASALIDLTRDVQMFLRYQQGFRPGGLAIEGDFVRRFRNDRVATIEAGLRWGRAGANRFDGALTLAHTSWRDIQADFIDGSGLPSTANIGDGQLWTIEATLGAQVTPALRIEAAASFNDSHIDEPSTVRLFDLVGSFATDPATARAQLAARLSQIPNIARVTARAGAVYQRPLAGGRDMKVDGWVRYVGQSRLGVGPTLGQAQGSYLDSGVTARLGLGAFGISMGVTNLANVRGNRFALGTPFTTGRAQVTPLRPRTVRVGLDAAF